MKRKLEDTGYSAAYEEKIAHLEGALDEILKVTSLMGAKEIAADVLDLDVDEFLVDDLDLEEPELESGDLFDEPFGDR